MPRKVDTSHCKMKGSTFLCENCGETYEPNLPAPIQMFIDMTNSFVRQHRNCKPRPTA